MARMVVHGGQVVLPQQVIQADVLIDNEKIVGIVAPYTAQWTDAQLIDAEGCYVFPGIVDAHTHIQLDTGIFQTDDDWEIGTKVAAYGGVTTVVDFATQFEGQPLPQALENRLTECQPAIIDYALHMMITDLNRDQEQAERDLAELRDLGIPSIKLYTTYRPNYYADDATILHTLRAMPNDMLALFHCENDDLVADAIKRLEAQGNTGWQFHGQARPAEAETEAALRVANLAQIAGHKPIYIVHCSSADTLHALDELRDRTNANWLYFESCIQYLVLNDHQYNGEHPEHFILQPPLRSETSRQAEQDAFLAGRFDVLSTDHCDYSLRKKNTENDFRVTAGGLPGLETLLPLTYTLIHNAVDQGKISLHSGLLRLAQMLAQRPAQIFGIAPQKGAIQIGADADLVIYDPSPQVTITQDSLHTIGGYSPYEGMTVQGCVKTTIGRGEILVQDGEFMGTVGRGQFLKGKPFQPVER